MATTTTTDTRTPSTPAPDRRFKTLAVAVGKQFSAMTGPLFQMDVDGDTLWQTYLGAFPPGSDPLYKTRTEHDCGCCRQFVKTLGAVVTVDGAGRLMTIWDGPVDDAAYAAVCERMSAFVRSLPISNLFLHFEPQVGTAKSFQALLNGASQTWEHFYVKLQPHQHTRKDAIGTTLADARSTFDVFKRSVTELRPEAVETVLDLIAQGSLYRGAEHQHALVTFAAAQAAATSDPMRWALSRTLPPSVSRIRNTAIGSLLVDLSEGVDLEDAVKSFEAKVAPTNYKRPTALVTKAMIAKAAAEVDALGLTSALQRRYATMEDITIGNVLFADRSAKRAMSVFDTVAEGVQEKPKLDKVQEMGIEAFLSQVLPTATTLEVLFENRHAGNLMSVIAPADPTAAPLFKWSNGFSWAYAGDVADSIRERVKKAGGSVTGDFRASLAWANYDDLDLHLLEPSGQKIYFGCKQSRTGGTLDVDMNAGGPQSRTPVENITYAKRSMMPEGRYVLAVNQFSLREHDNHGFDLEMEFDGTVHHFSHAGVLRTGQTVMVATFDYTRKGGLKIVQSLPLTTTSRTLWALPTQTFRTVSALMLSPNFWDGQVGIGNKHYFFLLEGCRREGEARGFFNEFLRADLDKHRKVLEMVGAKVRTDASERQLSGLGFSSTQRNDLIVRVGGSFTRTLKVTI